MKTIKLKSIILTLILYLQSINLVFGSSTPFVTYGSVFKLLNIDYNVRLHSHDVKYGTGSGQQSITGTELKEDINSHWIVLNQTNSFYRRGEKVKCGDIIRLQHTATNKNLHSHHFSSPLSGNQEVSAYGENGIGDSGDHWKVICSDDYWLRANAIKLFHIDTEVYCSVSGRTFGRPINGQMEIVGVSNSYQATEWKTSEGIFIHPSQPSKPVHTEL